MSLMTLPAACPACESPRLHVSGIDLDDGPGCRMELRCPDCHGTVEGRFSLDDASAASEAYERGLADMAIMAARLERGDGWEQLLGRRP